MRTVRTFCMAALVVLLAACQPAVPREPGSDAANNAPATAAATERLTADGCPPGTYKVAYQGPLTGEFAGLGEDMINGIWLAVSDANKRGLAGEGARVEVEPFDSQGSGDQAPPLARQAADDEEIIAMIGPTLAKETMVSGPTFEDANLPFITPSATAAGLSEQGWRFFFRTIGSDRAQAHATAAFIADDLGASTVAVVDDSSADYGRPLADGVADSLVRSHDVAVVHRGALLPQDGSWTREVADILESDAEAVFFGGYFPEAAALKQQLAASGGGSIPLVSDDGVFSPDYLDAVSRESGEPTYVTFPALDPRSADPAFTKAYREAYGTRPGAFTLEAYDAASLVIEGLRFGACDRLAMRDFLAGYYGKIRGSNISFDEQGEIQGPRFTVYSVLDDEWVVEVEHLTTSLVGTSDQPSPTSHGTP